MSAPKRPLSHDLIIPIYLDTSRLLDVLASLEGGFSFVQKLTIHDTSNESTERGIKGELGTSSFFSNFLKINMDASRTQKKGTDSGQETETERYHTAGSLLQRLRATLLDKDAIHSIDDSEESWASIQPSDIVELHGLFLPNPVIETFKSINQRFNFQQVLTRTTQAGKSTNKPAEPKPAQPGHKQGRRTSYPIGTGGTPADTTTTTPAQDPPDYSWLQSFFTDVIEDVRKTGIHLYLVETSPAPRRAVITLFEQYLIDPSMSELAYGEFHLLGKVMRNLKGDQTINLLQGTEIGTLQQEVLDGLVAQINTSTPQAMNIRKMVTIIQAPALRIVPIAIYV